MTQLADGLTWPQRHAIGVALAQIEELAAAARRHGAPDDALANLGGAVEELRRATLAVRPAAPGHALEAAVAQMRVLAEELRPRRLRAYGDLDAATARALDAAVQRLADAVVALYR